MHGLECEVVLNMFNIMCVQWLKEEFIGYLDKWEASVAARKGFEKFEKNKMLLSEETRSGLRLTGT